MGLAHGRVEAEQLLRDAGALLEGHFQLTSGKHSAAYVEKFRVLEQPAQTEALCRMIAGWARQLDPAVVAGPTTGGIIISYEVARLLGVRSIFAEPVNGGGRSFQRGFAISPGQRILVVDDVLSTGGSIREVLDAITASGGEIAAVAVLIDRTAGKTSFDAPFFACLTLDLEAYAPADCPLCAEGVPLKIT